MGSFPTRPQKLTVHVANDKVDSVIPGICHIQYETRNYFSQFDDILSYFRQRSFFAFSVLAFFFFFF